MSQINKNKHQHTHTQAHGVRVIKLALTKRQPERECERESARARPQLEDAVVSSAKLTVARGHNSTRNSRFCSGPSTLPHGAIRHTERVRVSRHRSELRVCDKRRVRAIGRAKEKDSAKERERLWQHPPSSHVECARAHPRET